jgi:hypothetical protein
LFQSNPSREAPDIFLDLFAENFPKTAIDHDRFASHPENAKEI